MEPIPVLFLIQNSTQYSIDTLESLKSENAGMRTSITIWNNSSSDDTTKRLQDLRHPDIIEIVNTKEKVSSYKVINSYLNQHKKARYVAKVDHNTMLPKDWLLNLYAAMEALKSSGVKIGAICGKIDFRIENAEQNYYSHMEPSSLSNGVELRRNNYVQDTGVLINMDMIRRHGLLLDHEDRYKDGWISYTRLMNHIHDWQFFYNMGIYTPVLDAKQNMAQSHMTPRILLATLCLNEIEWLPRLVQQHLVWPNLVQWVIVEAADEVYAKTNPTMVTHDGLSVDGTTEYLSELEATYPDLITHIKFGFTGHQEPDQGKCSARNAYMKVADDIQPDFVFVLDADEFYTFEHQKSINSIVQNSQAYDSFCFPHIHPWRPPSIAAESIFKWQITGGLWNIAFVRGWRWEPSLRYRANHNYLVRPDGTSLRDNILNNSESRSSSMPCCVHTAFTSLLKTRQAKHRYYEARGEGTTDDRQKFVDCRRFFEEWQPDSELPDGIKISPYTGPKPEYLK